MTIKPARNVSSAPSTVPRDESAHEFHAASARPVARTLPAGACDCHVHVFDPVSFPYAASRSYSPDIADLAQLASFLDGAGLERVVLVQPSVYGTDNRCLLDALSALGPDRARAVAVADPATLSGRALGDLRRAGVRGLRLNLEAKGERRGAALAEALRRIGPSARGEGLFVEVYADLEAIGTVSDALPELAVPVVLDHFAGMRAERGPDQPGFGVLRDLLATGRVWVKLSAPYRASGQKGYADLDDLARTLIELRPDRMLWASDWPHTGGGAARAARPVDEVEPFRDVDNGAVLDRLARWAGSAAGFRRILVDNPAELLGF